MIQMVYCADEKQRK